jgi:hypothetical protein
MDPTNFDELQRALDTEGPKTAIDRLCAALRERKDHRGLFHALLMKKRHDLGVSPIPTGPFQDVPEAKQAEYEEAIRAACRDVGRLCLDEGNIPAAWQYFGMIGEPQPVADALDKVKLGDEDDCQPLVQIALYDAVHPKKGFDLVLERFGLCNAITTAGNLEFPPGSDLREYCVGRLVRAIHEELRERLKAEIAAKEGQAPSAAGLGELIAGRDWLFEDDFAHIDVSHLNAVVQMSIHLPPGEALDLARELCAYGRRLSPRFAYGNGPPFEDFYRDFGMYLDTLAGDRVEEGIAHFQAKAENADPEEIGTYPAQVLVNLLVRVNRPTEALAAARKFLSATDGQPLSCPSIPELCHLTRDYRELAEYAREQGDAVHFMAGMIAVGKGK